MARKTGGSRFEHLRVKGRHDSGEPVDNARETQEDIEELNDDERPDDEESEIEDRDKGHIKEPHAAEEAEEEFTETPKSEGAEKGVHGKKHKAKKVKYHQRMNGEGRPPIRIPVPNGLQAKKAQDNKF